MSKIGQKPISISAGVNLQINEGLINVKGPKGEWNGILPRVLELKNKDNQWTVSRKNENKTSKSLHGLYRTLINNAIVGVEKPWQKRLEVVGTGFNVKVQGNDIVFKVGYSHPVVFKSVSGVTLQVEGNNKVIISGADKQLVGQVAFQIKCIRKPDVYKGKGIRYEGEVLRIKPGKKAKAAGAAA
ncbi:50S ribosomal protein L6 [Candidatus Roizmanbacteria bacterium CG2_30_33_16]|uniref:50S ribosomal protein L6 n=5 Tax=Candidatus Roizmaniibacteriota TaxID=1752723 RepID=A0A2M7E5P5_9BACT|nr:50S ribosomal protein L6 [Candidatus Roizmanbacteria bacterium]OIP82541.1 MAG: 50S ribosomal protein L6 [Candidatus Roizmanbacteria bacterium CG2_30_33_16]PIP64581.1 MAG: 50S ribosomal protein L6 [Candidatus Roizmanbacteria bacterium CG22_combo_CG10-13_8_21_14_all_33_16]PIV63039.1 MAG: 50S ribosomal protein L6 [Candidatus Roizmanbacteria bacterium CG01_land_8_20_14_3_00_33_9]PIX72320.1 MAG: 50S ribosomal protein L6 [Candidatus Roizmanbacteria bacterium CG_4_10_14_3_um_filter_33_21]PJB88662.